MSELIQTFINYFKSLSEAEQFKLGGLFNKETGGKLSPFNSPSPVSVALIPIETSDGIKLLAVRRAIAPKIGEIAFPGGFVNYLEEGATAAKRETLEETGLELDASKFIFKSEGISPANNLILFFQYSEVLPQSIMSSLILNSEVSEFCLINKDTVLAFPLHEKARDKFFAQ